MTAPHDPAQPMPGAWATERSAQVKEEPAQRAGDTEQRALSPRLLSAFEHNGSTIEHLEERKAVISIPLRTSFFS